MDTNLGVGLTLLLAIIGSTWLLAKLLFGLRADVKEIRRDVDRHEGALATIAGARERQGERIGELEGKVRSHADVCAERHKVTVGGGL